MPMSFISIFNEFTVIFFNHYHGRFLLITTQNTAVFPPPTPLHSINFVLLSPNSHR